MTAIAINDQALRLRQPSFVFVVSTYGPPGARITAAPGDKIVVFDRGHVRVEVCVEGGGSMSNNALRDEALSLLLFEAQQGGFHQTCPEVLA